MIEGFDEYDRRCYKNKNEKFDNPEDAEKAELLIVYDIEKELLDIIG